MQESQQTATRGLGPNQHVIGIGFHCHCTPRFRSELYHYGTKPCLYSKVMNVLVNHQLDLSYKTFELLLYTCLTSTNAVLYVLFILFPFQIGVGHDDDVDIDNIPEPVPRGVFKPVSPSGEPTYIAFDLETTDLSKS